MPGASGASLGALRAGKIPPLLVSSPVVRSRRRSGMDWLLIATGFTGALTLVWLIRLAHRTFWTLPSLEAFVCPAGTGFEVALPHLQLARREVVVVASGLTRPAFAQALVDVRLKRKVNVEVLLAQDSEDDPSSTLPFLLEQGLRP